MKLIISVNILCGDAPGKRRVHALLHKDYDTELVPMVGMEIEDPPCLEAIPGDSECDNQSR
jgi:hypothetical protein